MGFLERNALLATELNLKTASGEVVLTRKGPVHSSEKPWGSKTTVTSVGAFQSSVVEKALFIAHKRHPAPYPEMFVQELAVVEGIATDFPHLIPRLPEFLSWCRGKDGEWIGYLMDDFSEGGTKTVQSIDKDDGREKGLFPEELYDWIPGLHEGELSRMCFLVGEEGTVKMGDFNTVLSTMDEKEREERFKIKEIRKNLQEFTVFVPKEIE